MTFKLLTFINNANKEEFINILAVFFKYQERFICTKMLQWM